MPSTLCRIDVAAVGAAVACAIVLLAPARARADCDGPGSRLQWSSPADGETSVPLNAKLVAAAPWLRVRLDGTEIPSVEPGVWDPGPLEPGSTHHLEFTLLYTESDYVEHVTFQVGSQVAPPPNVDAATIENVDVVHARDLVGPPRRCFYPIENGCLDTCYTLHAHIKVQSTDAMAWYLTSPDEGGLAFGGCGDDLWIPFCAPSDRRDVCFQVAAIAQDGSRVVGDQFCVSDTCELVEYGCDDDVEAPPDEPQSPAVGANTGCANAAAASPTAALGVVIGLRCRRRSRRKG